MPWYAVHTRSRHEERSHTLLLQKSIHSFLPKMEVWSKRKDRRKKIMIPMFPGYLFVESANLDNYVRLDIVKTFGVVRILGKSPGSEPIPVPDEKIDAIRRIIESRVEVQQLQYPKGRACAHHGRPVQGRRGTCDQHGLRQGAVRHLH